VVEDDADCREAVAIATRDAGAVVERAGSVAEGRAIVERWAPDVVVSDIGMPDESGYALIHAVRERDARAGRRTVAVAITGYATHEDQREALAAGFDAHVAKPFDPDALVGRVGELLGSHA
jgi:CheY-like chemotaxis protein